MDLNFFGFEMYKSLGLNAVTHIRFIMGCVIGRDCGSVVYKLFVEAPSSCVRCAFMACTGDIV